MMGEQEHSRDPVENVSQMEQTEKILAGLAMFVVMASPVVLLVFLRRRLRRWWRALLLTLLILVPVAFFTVGGVAWLITRERVAVKGVESIPGAFEGSVDGYLSFTFGVCGAYGVIFAATGLAVSIPILLIWRTIHRSSFNRLTRSDRREVVPDNC